MNGGRGAWKGLGDIQRGRAGLRPVRPRAIRDHDGNLCTDQDGALQRWHEHFQTILNTRSSFVESAILAAKQYPVRNELKVPPTEDEVLEALGKLKGKKAAGKNGILPEMVKGCGGWMMDYILDLFSTVWKEERVPEFRTRQDIARHKCQTTRLRGSVQ